MTTLAELKACQHDVEDAVMELTKAIQMAQRKGIIVSIESMEIGMVGCPPFTQFKADVKAPMDLLDSLES